MISSENALKIALQVIPDLKYRNYKITDKRPEKTAELNLPTNCWYVIYSPVTVKYAACSTGKNLYLCIDKESGNILK